MSANTHYWTIVFEEFMVLRNANTAINVRPHGRGGGELIEIREAHSAKDQISNVFDNYDSVVQPLILGKYTSKRQLEIALRIIKNNLKEKYSDCFSTDYHPDMRSILRSVGGVGTDVIKHIVTSDRTETTKNWKKLDSFFEIITFWNNPDPRYIPSPDVQEIINTNKLIPGEEAEIERLDRPSQLSSGQLAQICESMGDMSSSRQAQSAVWKWERDDGQGFNDFQPEYCEILEAVAKAKFHSFIIEDKKWLFNFDTMTQTNTQTRSSRQIKRVMPSKGGKRTRKYKYKNRNSSKYRVRLSKRYNN